jgi:hypothetical protein
MDSTLQPAHSARGLGMVTALVIQDATAAISLAAAGVPAYVCVIPKTA